ncbi:unnamed protein product [Rhodiola kirilowii]
MDRRWAMMKSSPEIAPNCPRCASSNTKFCYYNNYSLSQPRYFCKGCRRYWTKGGSLRNVPVGGGCRKSRRGRSTKPLTPSADHTISSYMCSSDGGDSLVPHDSNGQDIDMAAVFAKFLDPNSETELRDHETDTKEDDLFFELTSSLGSNNQGDSFLIDCENSGELFCEEVMQEFSLAGHENFEANFGLDDLLSDQAPGGPPEAMWLNYDDHSLEPDTFCGSMVNQLYGERVQFPFSNDDNQMKGSDNGNGLIDHDWRIGSCFDVTSSETGPSTLIQPKTRDKPRYFLGAMSIAAASTFSANLPNSVALPRDMSALKIVPFSAQRWSLDRVLMTNNVRGGGSRKLIIRAARVESKGVSLGFRAPDFELPEPLTGKMWKLDDFEVYPALLVMFICNHCPFVIHLKKDIVKLSNFYIKKKGLAVVAISSNSVVTHPQDGPEFMAEDAKLFKYPFPYLYDESQEVARAFGAVCTPEFLLFKKDGRRPFELVYHGQFDDSRPSNNVRITGRDLSLAIEAVLSGQPVPPLQKPSVGCSIKWHPEMAS